MNDHKGNRDKNIIINIKNNNDEYDDSERGTTPHCK